MKLFISWSGQQSHKIALVLREWLPVVLPFVDPWVSSEDIPKGTRWGTELAGQLGGTNSGILCLVPGNLNEPWLNFEAGALSNSVANARVHPFLFGLDPRELAGPFAQFQATCFSVEDVHKLVHALNTEAGAAAVATDKLDRSFETCWPDLERRLTPLLAEFVATCAAQKRANVGVRDSGGADLTSQEMKVLLEVANTEDGLHPDDAADAMALHTQHVQHIMESLQERGLLDAVDNYVTGTRWYLSKNGRAFLVDQKRL